MTYSDNTIAKNALVNMINYKKMTKQLRKLKSFDYDPSLKNLNLAVAISLLENNDIFYIFIMVFNRYMTKNFDYADYTRSFNLYRQNSKKYFLEKNERI